MTLRNSSFNLKVVLCRIRLFLTLISKIKWLGTELPLKTQKKSKRWICPLRSWLLEILFQNHSEMIISKGNAKRLVRFSVIFSKTGSFYSEIKSNKGIHYADRSILMYSSGYLGKYTWPTYKWPILVHLLIIYRWSIPNNRSQNGSQITNWYFEYPSKLVNCTLWKSKYSNSIKRIAKIMHFVKLSINNNIFQQNQHVFR